MTERPRPSYKVALIAAALLLVPPFLWGGNFLYQRARIRSAIRACERDMIPAKVAGDPPVFPREPLLVLRSAGCRAVPHLLDALAGTRQEQFSQGCWELFCELISKPEAQIGSQGYKIAGAVCILKDPLGSRYHQKGMSEARDWWRIHVAENHPWWKPWSWSCMGD